jgi:hypothetical protein
MHPFDSVSVTAEVAAIAAGVSVANGGFRKPRRLQHFPDLRTPDRSVTGSSTLPLPTRRERSSSARRSTASGNGATKDLPSRPFRRHHDEIMNGGAT